MDYVPEGDLQQAIGANVARIRRERGLSQERLAHEVLGLSLRYVADIEAGRRNMTVRVLERLAESLGVEPLELLKGEE
ncbi:helix-turn-helix domain-containing protein [Nocardia flavorosea]|uniref:Helix-turn-helix transcriptional regulator n=1 Tax=Nocardia flavorosea TaxID=53429 RepID=A0A846YS70_9NOCA|nr:helix-turn-helix transcriptional regulator [Nocardia flavorosea]NKY60531.1 helix-turn-helix transcriptional regulator [Nocardia flavorosea]